MKKAFGFLLAVFLLALPAKASSAVQFSDIQDRDTAVAVECLRLMGVLDGYGDGSFRPEVVLNRAQFCKMAVCAMDGTDSLGVYRTVTVFPDVKPSHWAAAYINMAAKGKGVIAGFADGRFHPERSVTVGQAVTILLRMLGYQNEDIGGVWPDSCMSIGATAGLTDGIKADGNAPLNRGQAARLFMNLLQADCKEGGTFLSTLENVTQMEDVMLASSTADGPEGKGTAFQLADGTIYSLRDGKASNGLLNGFKGTLVLSKTGGRAVTFLPDSMGSSRVVSLADATATQLTDMNGTVYAMTSDIPVSEGGKVSTWGDTYSWFTSGVSLTLYLNETKEVEYVLVDGMVGEAKKAVIVYRKGSTAGFESLTGGVNTYDIYKNGMKAVAGDLQPYDVAIYSDTSNAIRVSDTRITAYYSSCYPNPKEPSEITIFQNTTLKVLPTAIESLSRFQPGDSFTVLLTEDNQVAGAVSADTISGNAIGIANGGSVELLCGLTVSGSNTPSGAQGNLVRVSSTKRDEIVMVPLSGGQSGDLNINERKLGSRKLADNVKIFQKDNGSLKQVAMSQLDRGLIPSSEIAYGALDWAGRVKLVVIGSSAHNGVTTYGRAACALNVPQANEGGALVYKNELSVEYGNGQRTETYRTSYAAGNGEYIGLVVKNGQVNQVLTLTERRNVPNSAWLGRTAVTVEGQTYVVAENVQCYNRADKTWIDLDTAHAYAESANLYVRDGIVRIVEIN